MIEYTLNKTNDADLRDIDFGAAENGDLVANDGGGQAAYATRFRLLKSDGYLYFLFDCDDDGAKCEMTAYNAPLYDEEVCELFFSPDGSRNRYFEFEINALNAVFCAHIDHKPDGNVINFISDNPVESVVTAREGGWVAMGRIPLSAIGDGDDWRFNAYRIKRDDKGEMILSAFSPTLKPNFHKPERFGKIILK